MWILRPALIVTLVSPESRPISITAPGRKVRRIFGPLASRVFKRQLAFKAALQSIRADDPLANLMRTGPSMRTPSATETPAPRIRLARMPYRVALINLASERAKSGGREGASMRTSDLVTYGSSG